MEIKIVKYCIEKKAEWDGFVNRAKNSHFIFFRDYMDYHSDRFEDFSLLFYYRESLISILPANINDGVVSSHAGLTFGGFLSDGKMTTTLMTDLFTVFFQFLKSHNITKIIYKCIPYIYHITPAEEDRYVLFINKAVLVRRDVTSTLYFHNLLPFQDRRYRSVRKGEKSGLIFCESDNYDEFWGILSDNLLKRHDTKPVHTLNEIIYLKKNFPANIRLFVAHKENRILAGIVAYINARIVHCQYIAASDEGKTCGALDFLTDRMIDYFKEEKDFFDFGISTENNGLFLNGGLIEYKEGFGARAVVHDFYEIGV